MEKLELKHLAPYLPYSLKCQLVDQGETVIAKLCGAYTDNSYAFFDTVESEHGFDSIKPILRPLSDLIEEINHNGDIFYPCDKVSDDIAHLYLGTSEIPSNEEVVSNVISEHHVIELQYLFVGKLFEWHFDVFGLIEKGLAIDINTLNN